MLPEDGEAAPSRMKHALTMSIYPVFAALQHFPLPLGGGMQVSGYTGKVSFRPSSTPIEGTTQLTPNIIFQVDPEGSSHSESTDGYRIHHPACLDDLVLPSVQQDTSHHLPESAPSTPSIPSNHDHVVALCVTCHGREDGIMVKDVAGRTWWAGAPVLADILGRVYNSTQELGMCVILDHLDEAKIYLSMGQMEEAVNHYLSAAARALLLIDDNNLGKVAALAEVASFFANLGATDIAERFKIQLLISTMRCFGKHSKQTYTALTWLAIFYEKSGRYQDAALIYSRALAGRLKVLGPTHFDTLISYQELGNIYEGLELTEPAAELLTIARDGFARFDPSNESAMRMFISTSNNLTNTLESLGKFEEGKRIFEAAIQTAIGHLGEEDQLTIAVTASYILECAAERARHGAPATSATLTRRSRLALGGVAVRDPGEREHVAEGGASAARRTLATRRARVARIARAQRDPSGRSTRARPYPWGARRRGSLRCCQSDRRRPSSP